jgi:RNA polymerase sigma-70 factor (ECF subfamily)
VLVGLFERTDISAPIVELSAYIYRSLRNRIIDAFRSPSRSGPLGAVLADSRYEASGEAERAEIRQKLFSAIDSLLPAQREVLVATEREGRSYRELSDEWDIPMGTLLARKHRAIRVLRKALERGHA